MLTDFSISVDSFISSTIVFDTISVSSSASISSAFIDDKDKAAVSAFASV